MADQTPKTTIKLGAENVKKLQDLEEELTNAEKSLATMARMGIDVSEIKDKLTWARETRETLLKNFS